MHRIHSLNFSNFKQFLLIVLKSRAKRNFQQQSQIAVCFTLITLYVQMFPLSLPFIKCHLKLFPQWSSLSSPRFNSLRLFSICLSRAIVTSRCLNIFFFIYFFNPRHGTKWKSLENLDGNEFFFRFEMFKYLKSILWHTWPVSVSNLYNRIAGLFEPPSIFLGVIDGAIMIQLTGFPLDFIWIIECKERKEGKIQFCVLDLD